jgi:hypothetical protein
MTVNVKLAYRSTGKSRACRSLVAAFAAGGSARRRSLTARQRGGAHRQSRRQVSERLRPLSLEPDTRAATASV